MLRGINVILPFGLSMCLDSLVRHASAFFGIRKHTRQSAGFPILNVSAYVYFFSFRTATLGIKCKKKFNMKLREGSFGNSTKVYHIVFIFSSISKTCPLNYVHVLLGCCCCFEQFYARDKVRHLLSVPG